MRNTRHEMIEAMEKDGENMIQVKAIRRDGTQLDITSVVGPVIVDWKYDRYNSAPFVFIHDTVIAVPVGGRLEMESA